MKTTSTGLSLEDDMEEKRDIDGWYCHYYTDCSGNRARAAYKLDDHNVMDRVEVVVGEGGSKHLLVMPLSQTFRSAVIPATVIDWLLERE